MGVFSFVVIGAVLLSAITPARASSALLDGVAQVTRPVGHAFRAWFGGEEPIAGRMLKVHLNDGGLLFEVTTGADTVVDFLNEQRITLLPQDSVFPPKETPLSPRLMVRIDRSANVSVLVDGQTLAIHTSGITVQEVLREHAIPMGVADYTRPPLDALVLPHMTIDVRRVAVAEITVTEPIAFQTTTVDDASLYQGTSVVQTAGKEGSKNVFYRVRTENGAEVSRLLLSSTTVSDPVTKVVRRGTKPVPISGRWGGYIMDAASKYGVDPNMMYKIMQCESGGRVNAYNAAGPYIGLFQFLESTYNSNKAKAGFPTSNLRDGMTTDAALQEEAGKAQIYVAAYKMGRDGYGAWPACSRR